MLQELNITNFALIDHVVLRFGSGLNILTGETGAGKSILIDALGMALGERSSGIDVVRAGADRALIEAVFSVAGLPATVKSLLVEAGLDDDENDVLILSREIARASGKSQSRINGRLVPLTVMREIGDGLVDIHGQHDHQALLFQDRHVDLLDAWCGPDVLNPRAEVASKLGEWSALRRERESLLTDEKERARSLDIYRYQRDEIEAARLLPGEEEELQADHLRLANAGKLSQAVQGAYANLSGLAGESTVGYDARNSSCAIDALNDALAAVEGVVAVDSRLQTIANTLREALSYTEDAGHELRAYAEEIEVSPERLDEIDSRLDSIRGLKKKYGDSIAAITEYGMELAGRIDALENAEAREGDLAARIETAELQLNKLAGKLTALRQKAKIAFARKVLDELTDLGMAATRFEVEVTEQPVTARGADRVAFLLSANPGEPLRPLAKIVSGGEMSRIMLALKSVMARAEDTPTMIFDEIDVGIGGRTAQVIADKLDALAADAQILCITHLPQIAARGGTHFSIEKAVQGEKTVVSVVALDADQRVDEIARMLSGTRRTEAVMQNAREMLAAS